LAHKINIEITASLADLAAGIPFIFFSTDLVFDGRKGNYTETDPVNLIQTGETAGAVARGIYLEGRASESRTQKM
jgi:dTDP-4-dehydrorhamnose reductase